MRSPRGIALVRLLLWCMVLVAGGAALLSWRAAPYPAAILGVTGQPFTLLSTQGKTFTERDLIGTPSMVFFGYTSCLDVCPTTMAHTVEWQHSLGLTSQQLKTIFVTVDPAHDTIDRLTQYLAAFDSSAIGLVGTEAQTAAAKAAFGIYAQKDGDGQDYVVNHTASVFLLGGDGKFEGTIAYGEGTPAVLAKIKRLVK